MTGLGNESPSLTGFAFAGEPLDRADHLREDTQALILHWPQARVLVLDDQGHAAADDQGRLRAPMGSEFGGGPGTAVFLGLQGSQAWFALESRTVDFNAAQWMELRKSVAVWSAFESGVFALARALLYWQARNRFCGVCGGSIAFRRAGYVGHCAACGNEHYPRVDPAVIVAVSDGQRLLLGRQASWPAHRYSVIAGFVEPGETLEQTVVREVMEEARVRVRDCQYLGAQPWPFPGALMLGFSALAEPDEPQVNGELEDARWCTFEEITAARQRSGDDPDDPGLLLSPQISIARSLIEHWYERMRRQREGR